jgi:hypothetical protein
MTINQSQVFTEYLEINNLEVAEAALLEISIHAMDEDVDPPNLTPDKTTHLLRLIKFLADCRL